MNTSKRTLSALFAVAGLMVMALNAGAQTCSVGFELGLGAYSPLSIVTIAP